MNNIKEKQHYIYNTVIGNLAIETQEDFLVGIYFENQFERIKLNLFENRTIIDVKKQLDEYFSKQRKSFDIQLKIEGTDFQKSVYEKLLKIEYGDLKTYKDIAISLKNPKAYRAVGLANNRNKIPIIIPCHRVVGQNNNLTGYAGGLAVKEFLINLEK